jgi:hypothetical protein
MYTTGGATRRRHGGKSSGLPAGILVVAFVVTLGLVIASSLHRGMRSEEIDQTIARALLVVVPFAVSGSLAFALLERVQQLAIDLHVRPFPDGWADVLEQVQTAWSYEQDRFWRSSHRICLNALQFGGLASLILAACEMAVRWKSGGVIKPETSISFALTLATATVVGFGLIFGRILVRIASQDYNSRMFAWATRSLFLVAVSSTGLFIVMRKAADKWTETVAAAVLLGIFAALLGEKVLPVLLERAAAALGLALPPRMTTAALTEIEGVTDEDVERFAEERIASLHDLAFCPTARLFFNTHHSLQRICDWQDQALLTAYVGVARAKVLAQQVGIRGAIDLQGVARDILGVSNPYPPKGPVDVPVPDTAADPSKDALCKALEKALGMDRAALLAFLQTIYADEPTLRLRVLWQATPVAVPFEEAEPASA